MIPPDLPDLPDRNEPARRRSGSWGHRIDGERLWICLPEPVVVDDVDRATRITAHRPIVVCATAFEILPPGFDPDHRRGAGVAPQSLTRLKGEEERVRAVRDRDGRRGRNDYGRDTRHAQHLPG